MKSRPELYAYWMNPPADDRPEQYLTPGKRRRSEALFQIFQEVGVQKQDSILEIGCNSGRNLRYLWTHGFRRLYGIEINRSAVELMRVKATVTVGAVEDVLERISPVDVIFTMAVLMHLHPDSEFVFNLMAKKARKLILTIENERICGPRHQGRNYREIFEGLGMTQIHCETNLPGLNMDYVARAFIHGEASG